jgi:predicted transcriptional regulator
MTKNVKLMNELKEIMSGKNLSIPMASKLCKVSHRSLYRWLQGEGFQEVKIKRVISILKKAKSNL